MSNEFVLIALLTLINVVLNVFIHVKSIVLTNDEIQSLSNTVVLSYKCVMMYSYNYQLHNLRNVNSVLMIKNAVL